MVCAQENNVSVLACSFFLIRHGVIVITTSGSEIVKRRLSKFQGWI